MKKPLNIINIDGTKGSGRTSQAHMLNILLKTNKIPTLVLHLNDTIKSGLECALKIKNFLKKEPKGVVISDGSIARMMVVDIVSGVGIDVMMSKYQELLHEYETINHQYGTVNLLMVMDDISECNRRIKRRAELLGRDDRSILDFNLEADVVKGMKFFDDNIVSKNLKFQVFGIEPHETMIEVQKDILDYLEENFDIDIKKEAS